MINDIPAQILMETHFGSEKDFSFMMKGIDIHLSTYIFVHILLMELGDEIKWFAQVLRTQYYKLTRGEDPKR